MFRERRDATVAAAPLPVHGAEACRERGQGRADQVHNPPQSASIQPHNTVIASTHSPEFQSSRRRLLELSWCDILLDGYRIAGRAGAELRHTLSPRLECGGVSSDRCNGKWIWASAEPPSNRAHVVWCSARFFLWSYARIRWQHRGGLADSFCIWHGSISRAGFSSIFACGSSHCWLHTGDPVCHSGDRPHGGYHSGRLSHDPAGESWASDGSTTGCFRLGWCDRSGDTSSTHTGLAANRFGHGVGGNVHAHSGWLNVRRHHQS